MTTVKERARKQKTSFKEPLLVNLPHETQHNFLQSFITTTHTSLLLNYLNVTDTVLLPNNYIHTAQS